MKKIISILCVLCIIIPCNIAVAAEGFTPGEDYVTRSEAIQFAEELKEMDEKSYDPSCRLIVSSSKQIDYLDAIDVATGIDDLYVLQFDNESSAEKAEKYYNSLSYVNYVEYDYEVTDAVCEAKDDFDFMPQCVSTVNSNIDDAIKLIHKEGIKMSKIKVGVIDSGIAVTSCTKNRIDGGYSYVDGYKEDGTEDRRGHGTKVAGTIIQNSLDNIRLYSYQIIDKDGGSSLTKAASAIYLGVADGCKVLNCSFGNDNAGFIHTTLLNAVDYATKNNVFVIAAAGNKSMNLKDSYHQPAIFESTITVGATGQNKGLASFSNFGEGVDIYATGNGMTSYDNNGKQVTDWNGTSAATPVVSSICALLILTQPNITVSEVKELLLETGMATNENNQNDEHRVIADAYECIKQLTGAELEQVQFDYTVINNSDTNCSDISFNCDDENASIYYYDNLGGTLEIPYKVWVANNFNLYTPGETVSFSKYRIVTSCAYAPGKAKTVQYFQAPIYDYDSGYLMSSASTTRQYNTLSRCQLINEKVIKVPEIIDGYEVQKIDDYCFLGNQTVETIILPETVKEIGYYSFANCPNLKTVIAPGVENCERYAFYLCDNLVNVEMPNLTQANTGMFKNCTNLEIAKLGTLTEIDNHAFYGCENLKLVKTTADAISFSARTFYNCNDLTIATPKGSAMETFAKENDIALLGEVIANGGNIRVTDAGLRFGYQYNGEENKNIQEYGFVYNSGETDNLTVDNALKLVANNRIDHGEYTTYNLVFTDVPYTDKAFNQKISAKAYIKIGNEYFYSDVVTHSYNTIANAVLNDETIDSNTKKAVQKILDKVV
ncbi:MAG: S8 family serine peptidase [Eubacterium sp.]|nr:S8 family serine peptidase [Eubacterium sp.]